MYPAGIAERQYQVAIVEQALLANTLVCLPTGLGKTFIAAVVMYNFFRWFPEVCANSLADLPANSPSLGYTCIITARVMISVTLAIFAGQGCVSGTNKAPRAPAAGLLSAVYGQRKGAPLRSIRIRDNQHNLLPSSTCSLLFS